MKRGPNKIANVYTMSDIYKDYIKDIDKNSPYYVTFKEYLNICNVYYKEISRQILEESATIILPYRMGRVAVSKSKPKVYCSATLSIDWEMSKKYHKQIRHINDHSGGYKYRFMWYKHNCATICKDLYRLVFSRTNKRTLAKEIKSGRDYYQNIIN